MTADPLATLVELPGVFEAVDSSRAAIDAMLREPALRRRRGDVRATARHRAAWASARLAGADVELPDFRPPFSDDESGRLCAASLRVSGAVRTESETWRRAPLQALARLHTLAAADVVPASSIGRPRAHPGVASRLNAMADVVTASSAPGVVVAAVVQAELLDLSPFGWGDALIARAATRLVLVSRGVDPDALTVADEGLLRLGTDRYQQALTGYQQRTRDGLAGWLIHIAQSVRIGAGITREICQS